jgi:hypothetical protein
LGSTLEFIGCARRRGWVFPRRTDEKSDEGVSERRHGRPFQPAAMIEIEKEYYRCFVGVVDAIIRLVECAVIG